MTLKNCTKEELIFVIERLQLYMVTDGDCRIQRALYEVETLREERKTARMKQLTAFSGQRQAERAALLAPYAGQPFQNIPEDVLRRADALQEESRTATLKWFKLAGIKIKK